MKVKCKLCEKEFSKRMFLAHVSRIHSTDFNNQKELELFSLKSKFKLTEEKISEIISIYENDGTILELKKKFNIPYKQLLMLLKNYGIDIKTSKEINNQKSVRDKIKKTNKLKYGVSNVSKSDKIKNKKKQTFIKNYGVDNIFKTDDFKEKINDIMLKKYGVKRISGWFTMSDKQKEVQIKRLCSGGSSKLEKRVGGMLLNIGLNLESQFKLKNKFYDYKIKNTNILVEVNGDFWHANPNIYKISDILNFPKNSVVAEILWKKDEKKIKIALNSGYKVLTLWERDITNLSDIELELYIVEQINKLKL